MSTKLKAGTSTSGAVLDADTTGILELQSGSTPTTAVTIDASQNVGIGTNSPQTKLNVSGGTIRNTGTNGILELQNGNTAGGVKLSAYNAALNANGYLAFEGYSAEYGRFDSSGNLLVGTTTQRDSAKITNEFTTGNNGMSFYCVANTNAVDFAIFRANAGSLCGNISRVGTTNAVTYASASDYRLKENVAPMTGALDSVSKLKPVTYTWKDGGSDGQGFIAHELAEICPDAVVGEKDAIDEEGNPKYQSVDTSFLVATLTAAIQELNAKVDAQAAEIAALKGVA